MLVKIEETQRVRWKSFTDANFVPCDFIFDSFSLSLILCSSILIFRARDSKASDPRKGKRQRRILSPPQQLIFYFFLSSRIVFSPLISSINGAGDAADSSHQVHAG
jgi:hypothetical protein